MDFSLIKSLIIIIPLSLIGISFVKRIITERRAELVIPLGIIAGITIYIFFLNLISYVFKGYWGILFSFVAFIIFSCILISKFNSQHLNYPKNKAFKIWKISLVGWGLFLYYPISHSLLAAESYMYYGIGKSFARGNFPILSPWQPDLYVAYHYGASIFLGAVNSITNIHFEQLQRFIPLIILFCIFQVLIFGFRRIYSFRTFIFFQIVVFSGLISYGNFMLVWPLFPIRLPDWVFLRHFAGWSRHLPTMFATMDVYGMPSRLVMVYNQMQNAFGFADFFLILFISFYSKTKSRLFWIILFASLAALSLINETIFPSAMVVSFLILFFKQNRNLKIFTRQNVNLLLFFLLVGLVVLIQGGMITDSLFRNKSLESGLVITSFSQIPEKIHYLLRRVFQILPMQDEWLPFRWSHVDFIPTFSIALILLLIIKKFVKKANVLVIFSFIIAALVPTILFYLVTPRFMPSDGNRFLTFTYMFLGIAVALEAVYILENLYLKRNKLYLFLVSFIVLWILIPSNLPHVFDFWNNLYKQNYLFQIEYKDLPPLNKWLDKNVPINDRVLDLAGYITQIKDGAVYYGGLSKTLFPYSGVLSPYWDGKYIAYMYAVGPDYLNILYTLNPSTLKNLKVSYLVIDKQYYLSLPKIRQNQVNNTDYFTKVFTDDQTISNYWISIYKVNEKYIKDVTDLDETIDTLDKLIPQKAVVYLDKEYEPYSWLNIRNAMFLNFSNRDLVFFPQGYGGYGFISTDFKYRLPKQGDEYDYLILKKITDPKTVCKCKVVPIWKGYSDKVVAWKVIKNLKY